MKAFPLLSKWDDEKLNGMDLRDYLAAKVMPAMVASFLSKELDELDPVGWMEGVSSDAYRMADAMLKAREQ